MTTEKAKIISSEIVDIRDPSKQPNTGWKEDFWRLSLLVSQSKTFAIDILG